MNPPLRAFALLCTLALVAAAGRCGEAPDLLQRLNELENENKALRKELARVAEEKKELSGQLEKLGREFRLLQASVDGLAIEHRQMEQTLAQARKDLEARVQEMVQQAVQGRSPRPGPVMAPPARFVERPYAGFDAQDLEPAVAEELNLKAQTGALVTAVREGSPAAVAGLRKNDVLTALDGVELKRFHDLRNALVERKPGQVVTLTVLRGEEKLDMKMTLGTRRVRAEE